MDWKSEYSIGIPEIDREHKRLLECIARLSDAADDRQREFAMYFALGELDDYVRVHFAVEEVIMRLFEYPGREAHVRAHRRFAERLPGFQQSALRPAACGEMVDFLRDWFVEHILVVDRQYAEFLRQAQGPGTARP